MFATPLQVEPKEPISVICYLRSQDAERAAGLADFVSILSSSRWLVLAAVVVAALISAVVAWILPPVYRAETTLAIVHPDEQNAALSQAVGSLGGLASLAGLQLPTTNGDVDRTIAIFRSRAFTDNFIKEENLLPVLYPRLWDPVRHSWRVNQESGRFPTLSKAYRLFDESVRSIRLDRKAGLVTLGIEWRDPRLAAQWANDLVRRINTHEQERAIEEAKRSIAFLQDQLPKTNVSEIRQLIYGLIDQQMRRVMLATVRDEYAFQVVDPALVPERPSRPKMAVILSFGSIVGFVLGVLAAILRARLNANPNSAAHS